nr:BAG family molecular chaperone regulator 7 [Ipomoea batatas]GME12833.1 BAG family molecular chaperone regulator 7 [Ipomoea batatas]
MSRLRRFQLVEESPSFFLRESSLLSLSPRFPSLLVEDELDAALDLLCPSRALFDLTSPFDDLDAVTDLIQIERTPFYSSATRRRVGLGLGSERKYTWTAEIKSPEEDGLDRAYKWVAEIKDGKKGAVEKSYKAYAKSVEKKKGKRKELSPQDAAMVIQMTFRAYLIRRSQALRALRELAIAKTKLKELRALFNNFSYRRQVARDAEERQRFSEKIIVLLLTVDAIEGADVMVRATKKSMVDELEAMLDVVDPQPAGKSASMRRRTFDMPDSVIQKELAAGVAQVVQMIDESNGDDHLPDPQDEGLNPNNDLILCLLLPKRVSFPASTPNLILPAAPQEGLVSGLVAVFNP